MACSVSSFVFGSDFRNSEVNCTGDTVEFNNAFASDVSAVCAQFSSQRWVHQGCPSCFTFSLVSRNGSSAVRTLNHSGHTFAALAASSRLSLLRQYISHWLSCSCLLKCCVIASGRDWGLFLFLDMARFSRIWRSIRLSSRACRISRTERMLLRPGRVGCVL